MKKRISSMKEAYFVEINSILIDGENKSRMNFSEDGRHLDKFPNESTIIQAIIFGKLLAEIQNKKDSNKDIELEEIEEGSEAFEYLLNEKREITKTSFSNTYIVNGSKFIDMGKGIYIQDLMTHMRIKTIKIKLDAQDTIRKEELEIIAINENTYRLITYSELKTVGKNEFIAIIDGIHRCIAIK